MMDHPTTGQILVATSVALIVAFLIASFLLWVLP